MFFDKFLKDLSEPPSFQSFWLEDKNPLGGTTKRRFIKSPNQAMKILHRQLIRYLRNLSVPLPFATGCLPKSSPLKNIKRHKKSRYFYLLDLKHAYQSVKGEKLAAVLCQLDSKLGEQEEVLKFLKKYCLSEKGGLIIGAPASPDLFNIYAGILLDGPLGELSKRYNLTYTRYLDDLTFSSKIPIGKRKRRSIREIIKKAGFEVNHRKTKIFDLKKGPIVINGVGLELGGRIFLPRHYLRKIKGTIYKATKEGTISKEKVRGMMGVFWGATNVLQLTNTERKLISQYEAFQKGH